MESFEIKFDESLAYPVFHVKGYYSDHTGAQVAEKANQLLRGGKVRLIIDFTECFSINSPGIASLMDLGLIVTDDFKGRLILTGLNTLCLKVLNIAGIIPFIESTPTIPEAIKQLETK
ncbi:MAG: STAS domain-containing protein [Candidatus Riflebacteria bacterium]|nr:STAS domain-containing protein [Candidatus Riflebacteria bacterium]